MSMNYMYGFTSHEHLGRSEPHGSLHQDMLILPASDRMWGRDLERLAKFVVFPHKVEVPTTQETNRNVSWNQECVQKIRRAMFPCSILFLGSNVSISMHNNVLSSPSCWFTHVNNAKVTLGNRQFYLSNFNEKH